VSHTQFSTMADQEEHAPEQVIVWRQGYPVACFLDEEFCEQVACGVCMLPCRAPAHGNQCAHTACRTCLMRWAAQRRQHFRPPTCPSCRRAMAASSTSSAGSMAARIAGADVCCLYMHAAACDWSDTFGVDGRHLVDHVLAQHSAEQPEAERPFFLTDAANARALEEAAREVPREAGGLDGIMLQQILHMLGQRRENAGAAALAPVPVPVAAAGDGGLEALVIQGLGMIGLEQMRPAVEAGFQRQDARPIMAVLQQWQPALAAQFAAGNHIFFLNSLIGMWVEPVIELLARTLARVPTQTRFFQRLLARYRALNVDMDEYGTAEFLARSQAVLAEFVAAFEPLLPLLQARDYAGFYASRPGHAWFDSQHLRRQPGAAADPPPPDDADLEGEDVVDDPDVVAATIEEVCEDLELIDVHLAQDEAHWSTWLRLVSLGAVLHRLPLETVRAWSTLLGVLWTRACQAEHLEIGRADLHAVIGAWFQHVGERAERVTIVEHFLHYIELGMCTMIDTVPEHVMVMVQGVWPMILPRIDPQGQFLPAQADVASLKAMVRHYATRMREIYCEHDEPAADADDLPVDANGDMPE
jgi:hypothetical protein